MAASPSSSRMSPMPRTLTRRPACASSMPSMPMADNRGELLFELRGATQRQFALYRVLRGDAKRIFLSGAEAIAAPASPIEAVTDAPKESSPQPLLQASSPIQSRYKWANRHFSRIPHRMPPVTAAPTPETVVPDSTPITPVSSRIERLRRGESRCQVAPDSHGPRQRRQRWLELAHGLCHRRLSPGRGGRAVPLQLAAPPGHGRRSTSWPSTWALACAITACLRIAATGAQVARIHR